jgi:hypothetical protein
MLAALLDQTCRRLFLQLGAAVASSAAPGSRDELCRMDASSLAGNPFV